MKKFDLILRTGRSPGYEGLSGASTASIWPTERGNTSNAPQRSSSAMCSPDSKLKCSSMRVPPSCSLSRICTAVAGVSGFGVPSWSAKPSVGRRPPPALQLPRVGPQLPHTLDRRGEVGDDGEAPAVDVLLDADDGHHGSSTCA